MKKLFSPKKGKHNKEKRLRYAYLHNFFYKSTKNASSKKIIKRL